MEVERGAAVIPFPARHNELGERFEPWVSKRQVAAHLGRSVRWVEMRSKDAGLPWHPPAPGSNRRRYRLSEVERWAARGAA